MGFEWNDSKNNDNIVKHGLSFYQAQLAFLDDNRIILKDNLHSSSEIDIFALARLLMAVLPRLDSQ